MLKSISNIGTILSKNEQKSVNGSFGGGILACNDDSEGQTCYNAPSADGIGFCFQGECYDC